MPRVRLGSHHGQAGERAVDRSRRGSQGYRHVDGRPHAVTGGLDRTVREWDLTTGAQVGETHHRPRVGGERRGRRRHRRPSARRDRRLRPHGPALGLATKEQVGRDLNVTWKIFGAAIASDEQIVVGFDREVAALSTAAFKIM